MIDVVLFCYLPGLMIISLLARVSHVCLIHKRASETSSASMEDYHRIGILYKRLYPRMHRSAAHKITDRHTGITQHYR